MPLWATIIVAVIQALLPSIMSGASLEVDIEKALLALFNAVPQSVWLNLEKLALEEAGKAWADAWPFFKAWWAVRQGTDPEAPWMPNPVPVPGPVDPGEQPGP